MSRRASGPLTLAASINEENDGTALGDVASILHHLVLGGVLETGTEDGKIDRVYAANGTASTSATEYNTSDGSLTSPLLAGGVTFADLVAVIVQNTGDTNDLVVASSDGSTVSTDAIVLPPGGWFAWSGGDAGIAADGDDILRLSTVSSTTTYRLIFIGRSA